MKNKLYSKKEVTTWLLAKLHSKDVLSKDKQYIKSILLLLSSISIETELNKARTTNLLELLINFEANLNAMSDTMNSVRAFLATEYNSELHQFEDPTEYQNWDSVEDD